MKTVNVVTIGDMKFRRDICGLCGDNAICYILKYRREGKRWKRMKVCTDCIPLRNTLQFNDDFVVIDKKSLVSLFKALNHLSAAAVKMASVIYAIKKKTKRVGKTSVGKVYVGFDED